MPHALRAAFSLSSSFVSSSTFSSACCSASREGEAVLGLSFVIWAWSLLSKAPGDSTMEPLAADDGGVTVSGAAAASFVAGSSTESAATEASSSATAAGPGVVDRA